jgi:EAL domain-containing protein (putative c-di-GMP-specific phosphodiesterase class I)
VGNSADLLAIACSGLREDGFAIALDDVGTARDGGDALDRLRPDYLKVDASVVRGIDRNLVKQEIFATIARQGDAVGAQVVAVGVESAEEAATLAGLGTLYAQGYHYAGPAPRERWAP